MAAVEITLEDGFSLPHKGSQALKNLQSKHEFVGITITGKKPKVKATEAPITGAAQSWRSDNLKNRTGSNAIRYWPTLRLKGTTANVTAAINLYMKKDPGYQASWGGPDGLVNESAISWGVEHVNHPDFVAAVKARQAMNKEDQKSGATQARNQAELAEKMGGFILQDLAFLARTIKVPVPQEDGTIKTKTRDPVRHGLVEGVTPKKAAKKAKTTSEDGEKKKRVKRSLDERMVEILAEHGKALGLSMVLNKAKTQKNARYNKISNSGNSNNWEGPVGAKVMVQKKELSKKEKEDLITEAMKQVDVSRHGPFILLLEYLNGNVSAVAPPAPAQTFGASGNVASGSFKMAAPATAQTSGSSGSFQMAAPAQTSGSSGGFQMAAPAPAQQVYQAPPATTPFSNSVNLTQTQASAGSSFTSQMTKGFGGAAGGAPGGFGSVSPSARSGGSSFFG